MKRSASLALYMKKIFFVLTIGLLAVCCHKPMVHFLNFRETSIQLPAFPDTSTTIIVESNLEWNLSLSPGADWLRLSKTSGKGYDTILISVIKDIVGVQSRTATLTATPVNASIDMQAQVTIEQKLIDIQLLSKKILGGSDEEYIAASAPAADGGVLLAGYTKSNNSGDVTANNGMTDAWAVKLNSNGETVWTRTIGGSTVDEVRAAAATSDGGFVLAGHTFDNSSGANHGASDFWITKLNSDGNVMWTSFVGTSGWEYAYSVAAAPDGSIVVAGTTIGYNGGDNSVLVAKLNSTGNLLWQKTFGGSAVEGAPSVSVGGNGFIYIGTYTLSSNTGDAGPNHGYEDYLVISLKPNGDKLWSKTLGGSRSDYLSSIKSTADGCIVVGNTYSEDGDINRKLHSSNDYVLYYDLWIVKLNMGGEIVWNNLIGGSLADEAWGSAAIATTSDGGYLISGYSASSDGDVTANKGLTDFWLLKLNSAGQRIWTKTFGGSDDDKANAISMNADGSFWMAGNTLSNNTGEVGANHGKNDAWVLKVREQ